MVCKATHGILRLLNKGGTALPGVLALKICPDILERLASRVNVIAVSGTNGKTSSAAMLARALENAGKRVFYNRSGANLIGGITTEFILNANLFGKPKCDWAVIECDEAATVKVYPAIKPKAAVITNLFRDQSDRYGDVTAPRDMIVRALNLSPDTVACINADCPLTSSIADRIENKTIFFGFDNGRKTAPDKTEALSCPDCGRELSYSYVTYANLGGFYCLKCGNRRKRADVAVSDMLSETYAEIKINGEKYLCENSLSGVYNMYNAAGVIAAMCALGESADFALSAIKSFEQSFGRMEEFTLGKAGAQMLLIKNTAAVNQTLDYIKKDGGKKIIVFAMNNRAADGRDTAWIEDAEFEKLRRIKNIEKITVSGEIADTLSARLQKAGLDCRTETDYDKLIENLKTETCRIYIMPSYTAMLEIRQKIIKAVGGKNFWE